MMLSRLMLLTFNLTISLNLTAAQICNDNMQASTPDNRFTLNGDSTVTDNQTGLIWKRCSEGQSGTDCSSGMAKLFTWQQALQQAQIQGDGWRLPNIKELASIVELRCYIPAINLSIFPNTPGSSFWSSSPLSYSPYYAWYMSFSGGGANHNRRHYNNGFVRLVRGGQ